MNLNGKTNKRMNDNLHRYWVFGLYPSSWYSKQTKEKHDVSLRKRRTQQNRFFPSPENGNRSTFRNVVFFLSLFLIPGRWIESENPISLKVIHHRQNPIVINCIIWNFTIFTLHQMLLRRSNE
jgi:hypothetical protein